MTAARSLRSGMTSINSVLGFAIVPALPFGGVGESGFGRIHGADGLREFSRPKAITRQRMRPLIALTDVWPDGPGHAADRDAGDAAARTAVPAAPVAVSG